LIQINRGRLQRVIVATTLATGALAAVGAISSQAGASQAVTRTTNFSLQCSLGSLLGTYTFPASLTGTYPASVKAGKTFSATKVHGYVEVPKQLDQRSAALGKSYEVVLTPINARSSDATPQVINGAGKGIVVKGNIPKNKAFKLDIPQHGTISVGPWKAGKKGKDTITFGNQPGKEAAGGTDTIYSGLNQTGTKTPAINITCSNPTKTAVLGTVSVT
jgi:hypothetical protein